MNVGFVGLKMTVCRKDEEYEADDDDEKRVLEVLLGVLPIVTFLD
jgi:hypothetical protein